MPILNIASYVFIYLLPALGQAVFLTGGVYLTEG